jgi:hypothetical protein
MTPKKTKKTKKKLKTVTASYSFEVTSSAEHQVEHTAPG